jgi:hypothetical protein
MSQRKKAFLSIVFTGLSACASISIMVAALGPLERSAGGSPPPIRWRPVEEMRMESAVFRPGEVLNYRVAWNGMPCAELRTNLREEKREDQDWLVMGYEGRTGSAVELIWSFRTYGHTWINPGTLLPSHAYRVSREKDETERSWTVFHRLSRRTVEVKMESDDEEPDFEQLNFFHGLDMASMLLVIRALELDTPGSRTLELVDGDEAYALELVPNGREQIEVRGGRFDTILLDLQIRALTGDAEERRSRSRRYRKIRLWLSEPGRIPVRMEMEVIVGNVTVELTSVDYSQNKRNR